MSDNKVELGSGMALKRPTCIKFAVWPTSYWKMVETHGVGLGEGFRPLQVLHLGHCVILVASSSCLSCMALIVFCHYTRLPHAVGCHRPKVIETTFCRLKAIKQT